MELFYYTERHIIQLLSINIIPSTLTNLPTFTFFRSKPEFSRTLT